MNREAPHKRNAFTEKSAVGNPAEQIARDAHARLLLAFDVVPEGLVLFDSEDRHVLWNRRYEELYTFGSTKIVVGGRFEDTLRSGLMCGQYPDARGREEEWLRDRLERHSRPSNIEELQLHDERWVRIEERRNADGGRIGRGND